MNKELQDFLEICFAVCGCCISKEELIQKLKSSNDRVRKKEIIDELDKIIKKNNLVKWPEYIKAAGGSMTYKEAEFFIKTLYAELTDKSVPKAMLRYFFENYYNQVSITNTLETIINDFKDLEKPEDQKELASDLLKIINANNYEDASLKINEYSTKKMDTKEAEELVKFLYEKLN